MFIYFLGNGPGPSDYVMLNPDFFDFNSDEQGHLS